MTVGTICGLLVSALVVVGFAVYGYFVPGGATKWRTPGVLVVEKETGTRYVYAGGSLHPVLNHASTRLLFGGEPGVVSVSRNSLKGVPHGQPLGIVGAPDALPAPGKVGNQVWTVCALALRDQAGALSTGTTLTVEGPAKAGGAPLGAGKAAVATANGETFLIWQGRRLRVTQPWLARLFGYDKRAVQVEPSWLDLVPVGPDLTPVPVAGRGSPGPMVDGRQARIGELFVARGTGSQERRYLLLSDGLAELNQLAYTIVAADEETTKLYGGRAVTPSELSPAALARLSVSPRAVLPAGVPESPPQLPPLPTDGTWCVRHTMADGGVEVIAGQPAPVSAAVSDSAGVTRTSLTAARITVQSGVGGLVLAGRQDQAVGSGFYLVTDVGVKFPLASAQVAAQLGYPVTGARPVPRRLLELLPTGPLLESALEER